MNTNIAETVKYHRRKSGLSQKELAKLAEVGKTVIFDIENGKTTVRLNTLQKVFKILNIEIKLVSPLINNQESKRSE
ncbi:MAG: helix-turn-helix domain-containing protein [Pseudomonadota bacterium]